MVFLLVQLRALPESPARRIGASDNQMCGRKSARQGAARSIDPPAGIDVD
jgi:hypothetical protein